MTTSCDYLTGDSTISDWKILLRGIFYDIAGGSTTDHTSSHESIVAIPRIVNAVAVFSVYDDPKQKDNEGTEGRAGDGVDAKPIEQIMGMFGK